VIAYIDSSVLLRIVLRQKDRLREWRAIREGIASALVEVECLRTLDRLRLSHRVPDEQLAIRREAVFRLTAELTVIEAASPVLARASQPLPTPLGTLDAIHLATALLWRERETADLVMATHDAALGLASRACGLAVLGI
jgi:predicted nucleic acid-binding protein